MVGPNKVFLDYIGNVLPSLGERSVRQVTVYDLAVPQVDITGFDTPDVAHWKGSFDRVTDLLRLALEQITPPTEALRVPVGARSVVFEPAEIAGWIGAALNGNLPLNRRKAALTAIARRELQRRTRARRPVAARPTCCDRR